MYGDRSVMIFEGVREIAGAYGSEPTVGDQQVADAVRFLRTIRGKQIVSAFLAVLKSRRMPCRLRSICFESMVIN